jgi:Glycosyl transferase family 2
MPTRCVIVPTYKRNEYLWCCLDHIRKADPKIDVFVFSDRGDDNTELRLVCDNFNAELEVMPEHSRYGNTYCVMEAFRKTFARGYDLTFYVESDVMVKPEYFEWAARMHEEHPDILAACGWVCNLHGPIDMDDYFFAWFYSPAVSFSRESLAKIVEHAKPEYYDDMRKYVLRTFPNSVLHGGGKQRNTAFFEQDGGIQYVLEREKKVCAWRRTALCHHIGAHGYNRPDGPVFTGTLDERVTKVETLLANPHLRAQMFGRAIVEREIGGPIPKRTFRYRINLPGGWQSELVSELEQRDLPIRLNSSNCYGGFIKAI